MGYCFVVEDLRQVILVRCSEGQVHAALRQLDDDCARLGDTCVTQADRLPEVSTEFELVPKGVTPRSGHPLYPPFNVLAPVPGEGAVGSMSYESSMLGSYSHAENLALRQIANHCGGRVVATVSVVEFHSLLYFILQVLVRSVCPV